MQNNETMIRYKALSDFEKNLFLLREIRDLKYALKTTLTELGITKSERDEALDALEKTSKHSKELVHLKEIIKKRKVIMHNLKLDNIVLKRENKELLSRLWSQQEK